MSYTWLQVDRPAILRRSPRSLGEDLAAKDVVAKGKKDKKTAQAAAPAAELPATALVGVAAPISYAAAATAQPAAQGATQSAAPAGTPQAEAPEGAPKDVVGAPETQA